MAGREARAKLVVELARGYFIGMMVIDTAVFPLSPEKRFELARLRVVEQLDDLGHRFARLGLVAGGSPRETDPMLPEVLDLRRELLERCAGVEHDVCELGAELRRMDVVLAAALSFLELADVDLHLQYEGCCGSGWCLSHLTHLPMSTRKGTYLSRTVLTHGHRYELFI